MRKAKISLLPKIPLNEIADVVRRIAENISLAANKRPNTILVMNDDLFITEIPIYLEEVDVKKLKEAIEKIAEGVEKIYELAGLAD